MTYEQSCQRTGAPEFDALPVGADGVPMAWGVFGDDDSIGTVNLLTGERLREAASLVRRGAAFPLDLPAGVIDPPFFGRGVHRHTLIERNPGNSFDDVIDNFFPQSGSQWDSLAHVAALPERFYNGASRDAIRRGDRNTIDKWARHGIAGRGVLLDVAEAVSERGGAEHSVAVTVADLESARARAGVDLHDGDILLVRTGYLSWYLVQDQATRQRISRTEILTAAGLEHSESMARYLWDAHVAAVASDTVGLEVWPPDRSGTLFGAMHPILIGRFGLAIGELWALDELAADCADDGRYEFLLVSVPMNLAGGIGSPANAIAIK